MSVAAITTALNAAETAKKVNAYEATTRTRRRHRRRRQTRRLTRGAVNEAVTRGNVGSRRMLDDPRSGPFPSPPCVRCRRSAAEVTRRPDVVLVARR